MTNLILAQTFFTLAIQTLDLYLILFIHETYKSSLLTSGFLLWQVLATLFSFVVCKINRLTSFIILLSTSSSLIALTMILFLKLINVQTTAFIIICCLADFFISTGNTFFRIYIQGLLPTYSTNLEKDVLLCNANRHIMITISKPIATVVFAFNINIFTVILFLAFLFILSSITIKTIRKKSAILNHSYSNINIHTKNFIIFLITSISITVFIYRFGFAHNSAAFLGQTISYFTGGILVGLFLCYLYPNAFRNYKLYFIICLICLLLSIFNYCEIQFIMIIFYGIFFGLLDSIIQLNIANIDNNKKRIKLISLIYLLNNTIPIIIILIINFLEKTTTKEYIDNLLLKFICTCLILNKFYLILTNKSKKEYL